MTPADWAIDAAWLAWLAVWMIMAPRVKKTALRENRARRLSHILPLVAAGAMLLFCPSGTGGWLCADVLRHSRFMAPLGAALVFAGLGMAVWARVVLAENWSGIVTLKQDHELIQVGPYGIVRHPIYTGLLTALLGTAIAIDQWRGALALTIVLASFLGKIRTEEAFMERAFGAAYLRYRRRVPCLIPFVRP